MAQSPWPNRHGAAPELPVAFVPARSGAAAVGGGDRACRFFAHCGWTHRCYFDETSASRPLGEAALAALREANRTAWAGAMRDEFDLPNELQELIATRIESYEALEVLLALSRRSGHFCPVSVVAELTSLSESSVEEAGLGLCQRGLVQAYRGPRLAFRYAPADAAEDACVHALALTYRERKLDVIRAMTAMAFERLRKRSAEAFRAFKDEPDVD